MINLAVRREEGDAKASAAAAGAGMQLTSEEREASTSDYARPDFHLLQSARQLP